MGTAVLIGMTLVALVVVSGRTAFTDRVTRVAVIVLVTCLAASIWALFALDKLKGQMWLGALITIGAGMLLAWIAIAAGYSMSSLQRLRRAPINLYLRLNRWVWNRLPSAVLNSGAMYWYGTILHKLVRHYAKRRQYFGTFFFRNRPELELMRRVVGRKAIESNLKIAVLGCSIGAEVYSILWTIRSEWPDLKIHMCAVDISAEVLNLAKQGIYTSQTSDWVGASIFERMTEEELAGLFEWNGQEARVKSAIRAGISWHLGDASDSDLTRVLGPQDIVVASNFLCHMDPPNAENCLRNIAGLINRGGYLFVSGVDLEVRAKVAGDLGWQPVRELIEEIHDGDPSVRVGWPWGWWGLEPLNRSRRDWEKRYAVAFQLNGGN
jgi:SAM-dependent methyltransferase